MYLEGAPETGIEAARRPRLRPLSRFQSALLQAAASVMARRGRASSFLVLIFHRVLREPDPLLPDEPDAASFASQADLIASLLNVLPLSEAVQRARRRSLPPRAACITFDDGYANNLEIAAPILAARRLPATVFVATGFLEGGRMWNDTVIEAVRHAQDELDLTDLGLSRFVLQDDPARRTAINAILEALKYLSPPDRLARVELIAERVQSMPAGGTMLNEEGVRRLGACGIEVGAHTMNHPILARVEDKVARREICGSKQVLEDILGAPVSGFAYPNGRPARDYEHRHVDLVRGAGFDHAVSTAWGCAHGQSDLLQIPRVAAWDRTALRYGARLVRAYGQIRPATV